MKVVLVRDIFKWVIRCSHYAGGHEWDLPVKFWFKKNAKDAAKVLRVKL